MFKHDFIFTQGIWVGEGKVILSTSPESIRFFTKWQIETKDENGIQCRQQVEIQGVDEHVINNYLFHNITTSTFDIRLENELMGIMIGHGIYNENTIGWEFRNSADLEGFEIYELVKGDDYRVHAEYASPDQYRTIVDGRIWKKTS